MSIEQRAQILFYCVLAAVCVATIGGALWAALDARRRDKSPVLVFLVVFLLQFPLGLIAWLAFRPAVPAIGTATPIADDPGGFKLRAREGKL